MKFTFKKPYDKFKHHVRKNCVSLRKDGYVYIPKSSAEKASKLNFEACKFYEIYPSEQDPLVVGVKFMAENKELQSCRKSRVENAGLSINIASYLKHAGAEIITTQDIKESADFKKKLLIIDFKSLEKK